MTINVFHLITSHDNKGLFINNVSVGGGMGVVKQILTFANWGVGGVSEMLAISC